MMVAESTSTTLSGRSRKPGFEEKWIFSINLAIDFGPETLVSVAVRFAMSNMI